MDGDFAFGLYYLTCGISLYSCHSEIKLDRLLRVARRPSALQIHRRKAAIEFRYLKAAVRHCVQPTQTGPSHFSIPASRLIPDSANWGSIKQSLMTASND